MRKHRGEPSPDPNNPPGVPPVKDQPCREPNFLNYNDGGAPRKIFIPDGHFDKVMDMYSRRDFSALGRYETLRGDGG